ncbi:hypothetical protein IWZ00DRAFT_51860 [Phyllosticta capitalensis]
MSRQKGDLDDSACGRGRAGRRAAGLVGFGWVEAKQQQDRVQVEWWRWRRKKDVVSWTGKSGRRCCCTADGGKQQAGKKKEESGYRALSPGTAAGHLSAEQHLSLAGGRLSRQSSVVLLCSAKPVSVYVYSHLTSRLSPLRTWAHAASLFATTISSGRTSWNPMLVARPRPPDWCASHAGAPRLCPQPKCYFQWSTPPTDTASSSTLDRPCPADLTSICRCWQAGRPLYCHYSPHCPLVSAQQAVGLSE